jgi:hypothetical protein
MYVVHAAMKNPISDLDSFHIDLTHSITSYSIFVRICVIWTGKKGELVSEHPIAN